MRGAGRGETGEDALADLLPRLACGMKKTLYGVQSLPSPVFLLTRWWAGVWFSTLSRLTPTRFSHRFKIPPFTSIVAPVIYAPIRDARKRAA